MNCDVQSDEEWTGSRGHGGAKGMEGLMRLASTCDERGSSGIWGCRDGGISGLGVAVGDTGDISEVAVMVGGTEVI